MGDHFPKRPKKVVLVVVKVASVANKLKFVRIWSFSFSKDYSLMAFVSAKWADSELVRLASDVALVDLAIFLLWAEVSKVGKA